MEEITGEEFVELVYSSESGVSDYNINGDVIMFSNKIPEFTRISNCFFSGSLKLNGQLKRVDNNKLIDNYDNSAKPSLHIHNCLIEGNTVVNRCNLELVKFSLIKSSSEIFSISECSVEELEITLSDIFNDQFNISQNTFKARLHLNTLNCPKTKFTITQNSFSTKENTFFRTCFIGNCTFRNYEINDNNFGSDFRFTNNKHLDIEEQITQYFKNCIFGKASFYQTDFGYETEFKKCIFHEVTFFDEIKNDQRTHLKFTDCNFKASTSFRKARIHLLHFNHSTFENSTFFQDSFFDKIILGNSIFEKSAFFDDIQIKDIYKCDRRTIRNIKLHLQKTENKIDYNKFRVYEFEAYKKDLRKQIKRYRQDKNHYYHRKREIKHLKRDLFILKITGIFSDYGNDWKRAAKSTISLGLFLYSILYFFEFFIALNLNGNDSYWSGAFRFFLVTDFFSPFLERQYLNNGISWTIFMFGKIFIAFGIYEMIQAFRKFKA